MASEALRLITTEDEWRANVSKEAVELLETALAEAKAGKTRGVALACVNADMSVSTGYSHCSNVFAVIGALARLQHTILAGE
jgi:hypothetical protein